MIICDASLPRKLPRTYGLIRSRMFSKRLFPRTSCTRFASATRLDPTSFKEFKGYIEAEPGPLDEAAAGVGLSKTAVCALPTKSSMNALHNNVIVSDGLRRSSRFRLE